METKIDTLLIELKGCDHIPRLIEICTELKKAFREAPNQVGHAHLWADPNDLEDHLTMISNKIYDNEEPTAYVVLGHEEDNPQWKTYIGRMEFIDGMWHAFFAQLYVGCWDNANRAANEVGVACYG